MYIYRLGYSDYDMSGSIELTHTKKMGKREFNNIVVEATLELLLERRDKLAFYEDGQEGEIHGFEIEFAIDILEDSRKRRDEDSNLKFIQDAIDDPEDFINRWCKPRYTQGGDIYDKIARIMMEKHGFKKVIYEHDIWFGYFDGVVDPKRIGADKREYFDISNVILDRVRKKFWNRVKKKKLKDVSEINKEKTDKIRKKIGELKTLQECANKVKKYNESRRK